MAKHVTKTVIEDIAYQLKNAGQWVHEYKVNPQNPMFKDMNMNHADPEDVLDDVINQISQVLSEHDPTFDSNRFMSQCSYKVE